VSPSAKWGRIAAATAALALGCVIGFQVDATVGTKVKNKPVKGLVTDSQGRPVIGATVYFIDVNSINRTPINQPDIMSGVAEPYDEPLEDIVNNADLAKTLPQAKTDKAGRYSIKKVNSESQYYVFVKPADNTYLPGGDRSRNALSVKAFPKGGINIQLSWNFAADATYIGSTACLVCHTEQSGWKKHAHALMFIRPSGPTANQDTSAHTHWFDVAAKFPSTATFTGGTVLNFQDFNSDAATNNAQRWIIYEGVPKTGSAIDFKVYLWQDSSSGEFKATLQNLRNPADPKSPATFVVPMLMGGYLRQRILFNVPGLRNAFPTIGYQAFPDTASRGMMINYDRSRKVWQEGGPGGGGITLFYSRTTTPATSLIIQPDKNTHNAAPACTTCHFSAANHFTAANGETLAHGITDVNGVYDFDGDGATDETAIGCEVCHGPGSKHRAEALLAVTAPAAAPGKRVRVKTPVDNHRGKFIVNPNFLGNDRGSLICGRCHAGPGLKEESLPPPGISRAEFLATYADPAQKGTPPILRNNPKFWPDAIHDRGGHEGTGYANWIESVHARNTRQLVACYDCHDLHGTMQFRYGLKGDPDNSLTGICNTCHTQDIVQHVTEKTGSAMSGQAMLCRECHMPRTGKGGAGRPGLLLATPQSTTTNANPADANIAYWENDQSSHLWDVPAKFNAGVAGNQPGLAMPVPYTNACGVCHDASKLQFQAPR
jgi:hypothetical protein